MLELSWLWWNTADKNIALITQACSRFDLAHSLYPFQKPSLLLSDLCHSHCTQETVLPVAKGLQFLSQAQTLTEMWLLNWEKGQAQGNTQEKHPPGKTRPEGLGGVGEGTQIKGKKDCVLKIRLQSCIW